MRPALGAAALTLAAAALVLGSGQVTVRSLGARPADGTGIGLGDRLLQRLNVSGGGTGRFTVSLQVPEPGLAPGLCVSLAHAGRTLQSWPARPPYLDSNGFMSPLVDIPAGSYELDFQVARGTVVARGYAVDPGAATASGVDEVTGFLDGGPGEGKYLGAAQYGLESSPAAAALGPRAQAAGWTLAFDDRGLSPGVHVLHVFARSAASHLWTESVQPFELGALSPCDSRLVRASAAGEPPAMALDPDSSLRIRVELTGAAGSPAVLISHGQTVGSSDSMRRNGIPEAGGVAVMFVRQVPVPRYLAAYPATIASSAPVALQIAALLATLSLPWLLPGAAHAPRPTRAADRIGRR